MLRVVKQPYCKNGKEENGIIIKLTLKYDKKLLQKKIVTLILTRFQLHNFFSSTKFNLIFLVSLTDAS